MQDYPDILATDTVGGSRANLLSRDNALKSCFAGTVYPSSDLLQGMVCYRSDLNKLYVLEQVSPAIWREVILSSAIGTAAAKDVGTSGDTVPKNNTANTFSALQTFAAGVALANQDITGTSGNIRLDTEVRLNANSTRKINFLVNSTSAMSVESNRGIVVGPATGGSKGAGTLNAVGLYNSGNQIKNAAYKDIGTSGDTVPTWNDLTAAGLVAIYKACSLSKATAQSLTNNTIQACIFDTENFDDDGWHDNSTNNTRITVDFTGRVRLVGEVTITPTAAAVMRIYLYKNGTQTGTNVNWYHATGTNAYTLQIDHTIACAPGDYFELMAFQNSGAAASITAYLEAERRK